MLVEVGTGYYAMYRVKLVIGGGIASEIDSGNKTKLIMSKSQNNVNRYDIFGRVFTNGKVTRNGLTIMQQDMTDSKIIYTRR